MTSTARLGRILTAAAALAAVWSAPAAAPAEDQLVLGGIFYNVDRIAKVDGKAGTITFYWQRRLTTKELKDFESIELDRYPMLATANKAMAAKNYVQAAALFSAVKPTAEDAWLTGLLLARQVEAWDKAGQFAKAADSYVRWLAMGWSAPSVAAPSNLPAKDSDDLAEGVRTLESAAGKARGEDQTRLKRLLLAAYRRQGDPKAADLAGELGEPAQPAGPSAGDDGVAAVRDALAKGDSAGGLAEAAKVIAALPKDQLPELYTLIGQLYQRRGDKLHAALAYMRVVVHFPASAQAPAALLAVGKIHEELGRPNVARKVYQDLADRFPTSPQAAPAKAALGRLGP